MWWKASPPGNTHRYHIHRRLYWKSCRVKAWTLVVQTPLTPQRSIPNQRSDHMKESREASSLSPSQDSTGGPFSRLWFSDFLSSSSFPPGAHILNKTELAEKAKLKMVCSIWINCIRVQIPKRLCLISCGKSLSIFICESTKSFGVCGLETQRTVRLNVCAVGLDNKIWAP